ncbi:MAG: hypothetical protein HY211_05420 [Candidatus Omnitrophica bacterium]|nr:hypothetical protein [Candidatus Omnitrophota bacterium]
MRRRCFRIVLILLVFAALSMVSWPVTYSVNGLCRRLDERSGWRFSVARAAWIFWKGFELNDLKVQVPGGGKMHFVKVWIAPKPLSLLQGRVYAQCRLQEGRIDPGSWGIRNPLLVEILSAGPVVNEGSALLQIQLNQILFQELTLQGSMLRLERGGGLVGTDQAHLELKGALARNLLAEMNLLSRESPGAPSWEPFQFSLRGGFRSPEISFSSSFRSISLKSRGEHKP